MENKNSSYNQQIECPTGCGGQILKAYNPKTGKHSGECNECHGSFCWKWFE